jgi:nitroimidazol reductase NimA-like FMN-containing flavoprotein (pyridoxamine 5'-phosphate oxidase superfamily)
MTAVLDRMKGLLRARDMCVLATCSEGKPHCSLMAYFTDDAVTVVYMVTLKQTQKYRNFQQNPQVSLLVDTRNGSPSAARAGIQALTVSGIFQPIIEIAERKRVLDEISRRQPHLRELVAHEDAEPFAIRIASFLLLDGAVNAFFAEV